VNLSPHVLVDATAIPRDRGGVGRYLAHLLPQLDALGTRMSVVAKAHDIGWLTNALPSSQVVTAPASVSSRPARLLWEQFGLPLLVRRLKADVLFSPHYTMPLAAGRPVVVTLHDATFFSHPQSHLPTKRRFFRSWIRIAARRASVLLVPSESARDELAHWARVPVERARVAPHGVDPQIFHVPSAAERSVAAERVGASEWIGFLGTLEPRKNVPQLIAAFSALRADPEVSDRHPGLVLALAGGRGWDEGVESALATVTPGDVRVLGFVPDDELAGFLGGATAIAYPSLAEGFGLPVAEAMACGTAVVTTRRMSLPEVGGDAALYTEPDAPSIEAALKALLTDEDLRRRHAQAGPIRAARFDWAASARIHDAAFREAVTR
jgi:glycosyltransferase involved in cell wall biosynthesis